MPVLGTASWIRPSEPIRGLDHLGVQAPSIALYTQLLPGITNVTDRARYYSFHPWVLWSFASPVGTATRPSVTMGLFQWPLPTLNEASSLPVVGA